MPFIALVIITAGLLFLALLLYKKPSRPEEQVIETNLSRRGEFIPYVIGCHKIENWFFAWAGDRVSREEGDGGGKGFLFASSDGQAVWYESAWHILAVGPGHGLRAIYQGGEPIWEGSITPASHPSGTTVVLDGGEGTFRIFWGERDQPINAFLGNAARVGVNSRWPDTFYIEWVEKRLGSAPVWPKLDYVACVECFGATLKNSDFIITDGFARGVNGGHAMLRMLHLPFPHGAGIPLSALDNDTLEELGERCQDEHLPVNMKARGETYEELVQALLQDLGYWMPQTGLRLAFMPWRPPTTVPVFDDDVVAPPDIENTRSFMVEQPTRIVFTFKSEEELKYETQDITFDEDAAASLEGTYDAENVQISNFTHPGPASAVARRRQQEAALQSALKLIVLRGARRIMPGQFFERPGVGRLLVLSRKPLDDSPGVEIEAVFDQYAIPDIEDQITVGPGSGGSLDAAPDIAFDWFKLPAELHDGAAIVVFRHRAHQQIQGSRIFVALQGDGSFFFADNQNPACGGGLLEESIADTDGVGGVIEAGPTFEAANKDSAGIIDLSGSPSSWEGGVQVAVVSDGVKAEVFFLESVSIQAEDEWESSTAYTEGDFVIPAGAPTGLRYRCTASGTSGGTEPAWPLEFGEEVDNDGTAEWVAVGFSYQLNNLIRAQYGSVAINHDIGARVYIIEASRLTPIEHTIIQDGNQLCVKSVPFMLNQLVPISNVDPVCKFLVDLPAEDGLRVTEDGAYRITHDLKFRSTE